MFEQYQGPNRLIFEYKEATKHEREEIHTRKVAWLSRAEDAITTSCT